MQEPLPYGKILELKRRWGIALVCTLTVFELIALGLYLLGLFTALPILSVVVPSVGFFLSLFMLTQHVRWRGEQMQYERLYLESLKTPEKLLASIAKRAASHEDDPMYNAAQALIEQNGLGGYTPLHFTNVAEKHPAGLALLMQDRWLELSQFAPLMWWTKRAWHRVLEDNPMSDKWTPSEPKTPSTSQGIRLESHVARPEGLDPRPLRFSGLSAQDD